MNAPETEIKAVISAHFPTESALARELGWPRQRLNKLTTGARLPTIREINDLSRELGMPVGNLVDIFLRIKSPNGQRTDAG